MVIMVMDGQGGGIGSTIIKKIREALGDEIEIVAIGTNSVATSRMMKAGANRGATGENAVLVTSNKADIIVGPIGIIMANAMMGEVTPLMAQAISSSNVPKYLLPLTQERIKLMGMSDEPLPHLVDELIDHIKEVCKDV